MGDKTQIGWTDATWNPVTGCTKLSEGCTNCYAEKVAKRLQAMGSKRYKNGFDITLHEDALSIPLKWKKPRMIFVNSMSDLFHDKVPLEFIQRVFDVMGRCPQHIFQVLTKRSERMQKLMGLDLPAHPNVWLGVTVESDYHYRRVQDLQYTTVGSVRFLSCEPLLSGLPKLDLRGIHWVIVGGESGPNARPMKEEWAVSIRDQCNEQQVPFFFKQMGGTDRNKGGKLLLGKSYNAFPTGM